MYAKNVFFFVMQYFIYLYCDRLQHVLNEE